MSRHFLVSFSCLLAASHLVAAEEFPTFKAVTIDPAVGKVCYAVTLADVLGPLPKVDYLEADIQQSEILVFPPFMDLLKRKVRRVHIGTHGKDVHKTLSDLLRRDGWQIVFDFNPNSTYKHIMGSFELNDGVLTALNPDLH